MKISNLRSNPTSIKANLRNEFFVHSNTGEYKFIILSSNPGEYKFFVLCSNPGQYKFFVLCSNPGQYKFLVLCSNPGEYKFIVLCSNPGEYKFRCGVCHKGFFDRTHLRAHVDSSHSKVRRYACSRCAKSFFWKHHLKRHLLVCTESTAGGAETAEAAVGSSGGADEEEVLEEGDDEGLQVVGGEASDNMADAVEEIGPSAPVASEDVDMTAYLLNSDDTTTDI